MLKLHHCQRCLTVLSDPTRVKMIEVLAQNSPITVGAIVAKFKLRQPTISHHLHVLKQYNFVKSQKKGNEVYYSFNPCCTHSKNIPCHLFTNV